MCNTYHFVISFHLEYQIVTRWSDYKTNRGKCGDTSGQQFIIVIKLIILLVKIKPAVEQTVQTRSLLFSQQQSCHVVAGHKAK